MTSKPIYTSYDSVANYLAKMVDPLQFQDGYDIVAFKKTLEAYGTTPSEAIHPLVHLRNGMKFRKTNNSIRAIVYADRAKAARHAKAVATMRAAVLAGTREPEVLYHDYDSVLWCLQFRGCRFTDDYDETKFNTMRRKFERTFDICHPVVVIESGYTITDTPIMKICNGTKSLSDPNAMKRSAECYDTYVQKLENVGFIMRTDFAIGDDPVVMYACGACNIDHKSSSTLSRLSDEFIDRLICMTCKQARQLMERTEQIRADIFVNTGHTVIDIRDDRSCTYICGNCGNTDAKSFTPNLLRPDTTGRCEKCMHELQRIPYDTLRAELETRNLTLDMTPEEYTSSKTIRALCRCSDPTTFVQSLYRIRRETTGCKNCKRNRTGETLQRMYDHVPEGATNIFQVPNIWAACMERYGSDMLLDAFRQKKLELYVKSGECKKRLLEQFGDENYVASDAFYEQLKIEFGYPNSMQYRAVYEKAMYDNGRTKPYTFPSGRVVHIQGYENYAIDHLLAGKYICRFDPSLIFNEDNIQVGCEMESVVYEYQGTVDVYHPDTYIKDTDIYIETKSEYWLERDLQRNLAKFYGTCKAGFKIVVMVFREEVCEHIYELDDDNIDEFVENMTRNVITEM